MPVLLRPDQFDAWLDGSAGKEMLVPAAEDMLNKVPVSQRVNSSRAPGDDQTLIEPVALAPFFISRVRLSPNPVRKKPETRRAVAPRRAIRTPVGAYADPCLRVVCFNLTRFPSAGSASR